MSNILYYGDNLPILREHIASESVDLVYLDPPFNSNAAYNVLFAEHDGTKSHAQIQAFDDTWHWDLVSAEAYESVVEGGGTVAQAMVAFRTLLGQSDMMAYLANMAPRVVELRRVMKPTGSLYIHCDDVAVHYLRVLLDSTFGARGFRAQITWKRTSAHSDTKQGARHYGRQTDFLLYYSKSEAYTWNQMFAPYDQSYVDGFYRHIEEGSGRRYRLSDMTGPGGAAKGNPQYEVMGVERYWRYSRERMEALICEGRVHQSRAGTVPQEKRYLDEMPGVPLQNLWTDIRPLSPHAQERMGYPTQKPEALLERILRTSSNEGDVVLDPFCGCGTTIAVAQRLGRPWVGIDITHLAITLMKQRLHDTFGDEAHFKVVGEPTSLPDAEELAHTDPYQFQWWALGLVGARPTDQKKGADKGVDGRIFFHDEAVGGETKQIILSVKAGHLKHEYIGHLVHVVQRENAVIGVLITMQEPTQHMRADAAAAGFYVHGPTEKRYPKLQLLTVGELLDGRTVDRPYASSRSATFKRAPKAKRKKAEQLALEAPEEVGEE